MLASSLSTVNAGEQPSTEAIDLDMDFASLLDVEVDSVSRVKESLSNAPAAVYVISNEEIRKRGVTSIPEALRYVPGLHVTKLDSHKWAISSRGFNGRYNNKMLVLIDGRIQYSPEYSGVYWETTDTLMADVEKIEVIRGPAAALWGLNAVNGVINITTKSSFETKGGYAQVGIGDEEDYAGFRYGLALSDTTAFRAYAKTHKQDGYDINTSYLSDVAQSQIATVNPKNDAYHNLFGLRLDSTLDQTSSLSLIFDMYDVKSYTGILRADSTLIDGKAESRGWNLNANYINALSPNSELTVSGYFDFASRDEDFIGFSRDTVDLEVKHLYTKGAHSLLTGANYRYVSVNMDLNDDIISVTKDNENTQLYSLFASDRWTLINDKLWLTLAGRLDKHTYSNAELQPSLRLSWQANEKNSFWTAISKAVRLPSILENEAITSLGVSNPYTSLNPFPFHVRLSVDPGTDYDNEEVRSIELGHRLALSSSSSLDTTIFYNDYENLRNFGINAVNPMVYPVEINVSFDNSGAGQNKGFETTFNWAWSKDLDFKLNYSYSSNNFPVLPQVTAAPEQIVTLQSEWRPRSDVSILGAVRFVDEVAVFSSTTLDYSDTKSFTAVDIDVNWNVTKSLTLSAHGRNLFTSSHTEFLPELFYLPYRVEPSFHAAVTYEFD
jgi:iron complex outermembrane receptor protein